MKNGWPARPKVSSVDELFLQAEIGLHWAFVYLKFGHEFDGALNLRQAYQATQEIKKRYPKFTAIQKTEGLLNVIIGSVPEKYNWVLSLWTHGRLRRQRHGHAGSFATPTTSWRLRPTCCMPSRKVLSLQQTGPAMQEAQALLEKNPSNRLVLFLGHPLAMKNAPK